MSETITHPEFHFICPESDLPIGKSKRTVVNSVTVALFHTEEGFYAIEDTCPHQGGSLAFGQLDGCVVACPRHGAHFDVRNGDVLSLPSVRGVRSFPVRLESGRVFVSLEPVTTQVPDLLHLG